MGKASRRKRGPAATPHRAEAERVTPDTTSQGPAARAAASGATFPWRFFGRATWVYLALAAPILVIYARVRLYPFINSDDPTYVTANPHVLQGLSWSNVQWAFTDAMEPYWQPLTFLSHMLDVQLFGTNAGGHHVTNLVLHIANTLLLFALFLRMTGTLGRSAFVAALFGLHPLRVESVAWVAERKDVLSTFFWIATTWAYVLYARRPRGGTYFAVIGLFALGSMAKPMIVTLPFALLLLDYWPLGRMKIDGTSRRGRDASLVQLVREKIPLFVIALVASLITFTAQRQVGAVNSLEAIPLSLRVANALHSYVAYIGDLIWPTRLAALYPYPDSVSAASPLVAVLVLVAVTVLVVAARRRSPYLLVGWLWYLGTLLPVIGLIQVGPQARADRFTYIPHIGLFLILAWGIPDLLSRWSKRRVVLVPLAAAALGACIVLSKRQVTYWERSTTLWEHTLLVTPENGVAHFNLGVELESEGKDAESLGHLREATRIEPNFAFAHNRLATALARQGDLDGASIHFAEVVRIMPSSAEARDNLGVALARQGKTREAMEQFSEALLLDPADKTARSRLESLRRGGTISRPN